MWTSSWCYMEHTKGHFRFSCWSANLFISNETNSTFYTFSDIWSIVYCKSGYHNWQAHISRILSFEVWLGWPSQWMSFKSLEEMDRWCEITQFLWSTSMFLIFCWMFIQDWAPHILWWLSDCLWCCCVYQMYRRTWAYPVNHCYVQSATDTN